MTATANTFGSVDLITRAQSGDECALNDLCAHYLPRLQKWARGRLPSWATGPVDTQDLVQDTFAHVVQRLGSFEPRHEGAFEGYLRQALINRLRDQLRWAQRRPTEPLEFDCADGRPSPMEEAIGSEAVARYQVALARLKTPDRDAIVARIERGLAYEDVARALGKPTVAAAHVAVSRALAKLAKEMGCRQFESRC
jgi:RNA polymerase sigma factor (sigma-70 family)